MPKLHELREQRAAKVEEMRGLVAGAETANRDLNAEEKTRFDALKGETTALEERIARQEALDEAERRIAAQPINREFERETRAYSVAKGLQELAAGRLTGREAEIQQELSKGREARGLMVPSDILLGGERRDGQITGSGPAGGYAVATQLATITDRFRPSLVIERLGATVLRGLSGDLDLPKLTASGTTHWIGENADTTRSAAEFGKVSMKPKTVSAEYRLSRRMQIQPAQSIEQLLRADLGKIIAQAVDAAALAGSGAGAEPEGLLNSITPYVTVSTELCDIASELMSSLEADNVTGGAFCTSSVVLGMARKIKDGEGLSIPIAATFHGQRVEQTTLVPADLGGSNDKSALIWGLWSELMLAYWSGVDIVPNQYHPDVSSNGGLLLHAFLDCDVAVRHSEAFVWSEI